MSPGCCGIPKPERWELWSAPMSLREVEPQIRLQLDQQDRSLPEAPSWGYDRPSELAMTSPAGAG